MGNSYNLSNEYRSKIVALLLLAFFGGLGVHNFYLGRKNQGIIELVLSIFGALTAIFLIGFIPLLVVGIMVIIDFFKIIFVSENGFGWNIQ